MTIAQAGSNYNYLSHTTSYFTGNYAIESTQTNIKNELMLLPFIGHSFQHADVYFGFDPSLFEEQSNINHLIGFADYDHPGTNITGAPVNLSSTVWRWGDAAQLGMTYAFSPSWFLDFNYTYVQMFKNTIRYVAPFTNQIGPETLVGTSYINSTQRANTRSVSVSINKAF